MTATRTPTTLESFLADRDICRVWWSGVGSPTGSELVLNDEDGVADEDYCDAATLAEFIPAGADDLEGEVTVDADGEHRWEAADTGDLRDNRGNTVYRLVVWAAPQS